MISIHISAQVLEIPSSHTGDVKLVLDEEWLAIVRLANPYMSFAHRQGQLPAEYAFFLYILV